MGAELAGRLLAACAGLWLCGAHSHLVLLGPLKMQRCLLGQLSNGQKTELVWDNETNDRTDCDDCAAAETAIQKHLPLLPGARLLITS